MKYSASIVLSKISLIVVSICHFVASQDSTYAKLAKCEVSATTGKPAQKISGVVKLRQERFGVVNITTITVKLSGFTGAGKHGFHVHQEGQLGNECSDAKGHYNPYNKSHGAPTDTNRHVGDMGNIEANNQGKVDSIIEDTQVKLYGDNDVMGRSIVIHERADDFSHTSLTGNAGGRLACCVIVEESGADDPDSSAAGLKFSLLGLALCISTFVTLL